MKQMPKGSGEYRRLSEGHSTEDMGRGSRRRQGQSSRRVTGLTPMKGKGKKRGRKAGRPPDHHVADCLPTPHEFHKETAGGGASGQREVARPEYRHQHTHGLGATLEGTELEVQSAGRVSCLHPAHRDRSAVAHGCHDPPLGTTAPLIYMLAQAASHGSSGLSFPQELEVKVTALSPTTNESRK